MSRPVFVALAPISLLAATLLLAGCGSEAAPVTAETSKFRPADSGSAAEPATTELTATEPSRPSTQVPGEGATTPRLAPGKGPLAIDAPRNAAPTSLTVPDGDIDTLSAFIDRLANVQPQGSNREEMIASFARTQDARLTAVKKILAQKPDARTKESVVQVAFEIFRNLQQLGVPGTRDKLDAFGRELTKNEDAELARLGRYMLFNTEVQDLAGKSQDDGAPVVARTKKFIAEEQGDLTKDTLQQVGMVAELLLGMGLKKDGLQVLELAADTAAASKDEKVAAEKHTYRNRAAMMELDPQALLESVVVEEKDAAANLSQKLKAALSKATPSAEVMRAVQQLAFILELSGHGAVALDVFDQLQAHFEQDSPEVPIDKELAAKVAASAEKAHQRAALAGQPVSIEGIAYSDKQTQPFDWSAYQGKVVLLDFWATWCDPCIREMSNIRLNYDEFHDSGFDVVGVSLDTEVDNLKRFTIQNVPWTIVTSQEVLEGAADKEDFTKLPMAAKFGVEALPFVVLVGKDGKVDSLHVMGPKLRARLVALLGEPEAKPEAEKPSQGKPPADGAPAAKAKPGESPAAAVRPARESGAFATPATVLLAAALLAADPSGAAPVAAADDPAINPYTAKPGLTTEQLTSYIQKMLDKPKTIQGRPGFCAAVCEACERVLAADPPANEVQFFIAAEAKLETLHKQACTGDAEADKQLAAFVERMKADQRPRIARQVAFFQEERKVLDAVDGPPENIPDLLQELQDYYSQEKLSARHLRMASSTVALVNKLADGDEREKQFGQFGGVFAKSSDKELARYGKKLAKKPAATESDLVGKPLELDGTTAKGAAFVWEAYRGKVVLVDFWATWCGPCRREMPHVKELYEKLSGRGFEVVGVSLDEDQEALAAYLEENAIAWETLAGDQTQQLAEKYSVRGIPTIMLVDQAGKVVGVAHDVASLAPLAEKLLGDAPAAR